jgi:hypothetical protein
MNAYIKKMSRPSAAKLQKQCDVWNAANPVGTAVILTRDSGCKQQTKTRSEAQVLSGHSAVIWLDDVSGCYSLNNVTPVR